MEIKVTKEDLISMVKGKSPYYNLFDNDLIKSMGSYSDTSGWHWNDFKLNKLSEDSLLTIYTMCKNSWPKD